MNNGVFGERFPYTNFHDLNLDWILSVIKQFKEEYTDIINEINAKLNKPVINPDGNLDDVLFSNGDGTTRWDRLEFALGAEIAQAVDEWLDEHPEATTTVLDGSIDLLKLEKKLRSMVTAPLNFEYTSFVRRANYNNGFLTTRAIQSICYDSTRNKFIVGCSVSGTTEQSTLIILNSANLNDIDRTVDLNLGHCNDMKYEPETDTLFIATGTEILLLNAGTYSIKQRLSFENINPWQFAIMPDGSYFVSDDMESRIYNSDFSNYTVYATNITTHIVDYLSLETTDVVMQSAVIIDDIPYLIYNILQSDGSGYYKTVFASVRNNEVVAIKSCYDFPEIEGATVVGDYLYSVFGQEYAGIGKQNLYFETLPENKMIAIPANADLNDYIIPGVYLIRNTSIAQTLGHIPFDATYSGGKLIVDKTNANNIRQTLVMEVWGWGEQIYTRGYNGNFFDWYRLSMRKETKDANGRYETGWLIAPAYLTNGKKDILATFNLGEYGTIGFEGLWVRAIAEGTYIIGTSSSTINIDTDESAYNYTITNSNTGSYEVRITKKDGTQFGATNNNIPVILTWSAYYKLL